MKTLTKILAGIIVSISAFTSFANELTNGDFELNPPTAYGNNTYHSVAPWGFSGSGYSNVVHVDGPGGSEGYGKNGPDSDATNSGAGIWRNYLDIVGSGSVYQSFTTPEKCSGEVRFGGFFSTRGNSTGTAQIEIRNGTGLSGVLIGTTANIFLDRGDSRRDPWTPVNFSTTLSAGTTYTLVVTMANTVNFDEAYVNFVKGPCKDDIDLDDDDPEQCLILDPKVECVANKWQVSITNSSSSFDADVLDITSLTSGVTISGTAPTWTLEGALPNSSVDIEVDGTVKGGGKADFADLCCTTKLHIDIPDEECEIKEKKPHIYTRKSYVETEEGKGEFRFILDSWVQLNDPMTLTITDNIPAGVTLTSLDSANTANWSCPGLPVVGPGTLVCTYIGAMPIPAGTNFNVLIYADVDPSEETRENCIETNLVDTNGGGIPYDGVKGFCAEIPAEDIECATGEILVDGECIPEEVDDPVVPLACNNNIVIVADESGSIAEANAKWTVQNAIKSFVKGFKGNGSKAAIIHFDTNAMLEKTMTEIATSPGQEGDFDNNYSPASGYTNWEAGLKLALAEVTATPGSIVFFITDGQPNRYLDNAGNVQTGTEAQSVAEAVTVANQIKLAGSRIIAIGVGDITGSANAQTNLNSIASSSTDTVVDQMSNLNQIAVNYATQACPDIYLSKKTIKNRNINLATSSLSTTKPEFLITVTNNTSTALTGVTVQDALPIPKLTFNAFSAGSPSIGVSTESANVITWSGISLAPAASATLKFTANVAMQVGERVYNYAEVTAVDQTVSSINSLADSMAGPLNADDKDEGKDYVYVYDYVYVPPVPCEATVENPENCIVVKKEIVKTEGNCLPGVTCKYKITIWNTSNQAYINPLYISDSYTPSASSGISAITALGGAPTPMCSPTPNSIPFSCIQNTDLPANTIWTYEIETTTPLSGIGKNCFSVGDRSGCAIHLSTKSLKIVTEEQLTIDKLAPKTCKAGKKCTFTFTITNKMKKPYSGFVGITDKPRKRFGRIRGKSKGWSCKKKGREYRCGVDKLILKKGEKRKMTLTLQVPRSLSGKVENCATVEAQMPAGTPASPKSCVTVEIINDRKCGYDDKLVNGRCVARCKSKNSNWNGVDCMVCRNGKTWNDRYKRCDKKPKEDIIKSCPNHYRWSNAQNRCIYYVPKDSITKIPNCNKGTHYDSRKKRCVENSRPVQCNKGTHYDARKKRCVEIKVKPPSCNKGTHYDAGKKRCVENKRSHPTGCPAGQIYVSDIKRCVKVKKETPKPTGGPSSCGDGMLWNGGYKKCVPLPETDGGDDGSDSDGGGHP
jgi:hypothetical protein